MYLPLLFLALAADVPADATSVTICNGMKIRLEDVQLSVGQGRVVDSPPKVREFWISALPSGVCDNTRGAFPPGDYTLRFIEHGPNGETAMCARRVTVKPGDTIRISPDDGAQCIQ